MGRDRATEDNRDRKGTHKKTQRGQERDREAETDKPKADQRREQKRPDQQRGPLTAEDRGGERHRKTVEGRKRWMGGTKRGRLRKRREETPREMLIQPIHTYLLSARPGGCGVQGPQQGTRQARSRG